MGGDRLRASGRASHYRDGLGYRPSALRALDRLGLGERVADQEDVIRHDLYYLDPPLPSFVDGNVALIGDAAHAMTPDLGQGACPALIDAVALAGCLAGDGDGGLRAYDQLRRKPTQRIAAMALRASKLSQMRFTPLRDAAVKLALFFGPPA